MWKKTIRREMGGSDDVTLYRQSVRIVVNKLHNAVSMAPMVLEISAGPGRRDKHVSKAHKKNAEQTTKIGPPIPKMWGRGIERKPSIHLDTAPRRSVQIKPPKAIVNDMTCVDALSKPVNDSFLSTIVPSPQT